MPMPSSKAEFDVLVDVNVKTGKVDVTSLLERLSNDIASNLKKIKAKELNLPVKFNLDKSKQEVRDAFKQVNDALARERDNLSKKARRNQKAGSALKGVLGNITEDGKIAEEKLRTALGKIARSLKLSDKIGTKSPLAPFLKLIGQDVTTAKKSIDTLQVGFEKALNSISAKAKTAAAQQKQAFADLSNSLDSNIANKAVKASESINKITAAVKGLKSAQQQLGTANLGASNDKERLQALKSFKSKVASNLGALKTFRASLKETGASSKDIDALNKSIGAMESLLTTTAARAQRVDEALKPAKIVKVSEAYKKVAKSIQDVNKAQIALAIDGKGAKTDQDRLKALQAFSNKIKNTLVDVTAFRDKLAAAGKGGKDLDKLNSTVSTLTQGFKQVGESIDNVKTKLAKKTDTKNLSDVQKAVNANAKAYDRLQAAKEKTASAKDIGNAAEVISALKSERAATQNQIVALKRLIGAKTKAKESTVLLRSELRKLTKEARVLEKSLRGPTKTMLEFANSLKTFVRFAVAFKVLGGISQAFGFLAGSVVTLDDALKSIQAVSAATAEEMVVVENAIKNVATTTQFTTEQIAEAAQTLAQAGIGPDSIAETLGAVATFASATNASLGVAADLISTMKNVFKELNPVEIADQLTNAINISKLTAGDLQTILSRLAQTSESFNITSKQMFSAITVLRNAGIKASTVSTGLRQGLLELLSPDAKTLKVLEKRYAAIGENLSQTAISTMFSSFAEDDNPILRVLNELEKLGIQGSGAEDFSRVFDVRAENVIKALIANKEQFVQNTEAIGRTGSAAKGAEVRLQSLAKSVDNLGAILSVIASDVSTPFVDFLKDIVSGATDASNAIRDTINQQKELTGSTGVGASIEVGAAAGAAVAVKGGGAVKAALVGAVTGIIAGAVNTQAGKAQPVTEGLTKVIATVAEIVAGVGILKAIFPSKDVSALSTKTAFFTKQAKGVKGFAKGFLSFAGKANGLLLGLTALTNILELFGDDSVKEALEKIEAQKQAISKRIEEGKKSISKLESDLAQQESQGLDSEAITREISDSQNRVAELTGDVGSGAAEFLNTAALGVKDAGSKVFKDSLAEFNALLAEDSRDPVSAAEFSDLLQGLTNITAKAEGKRLLFLEELNAAYDTIQLPESQEFIAAFDKLTEEQQAFFKDSVDNADEAREFFENLNTVDLGGTSLEDKGEQLEKARASQAQRQQDLFDKQIEAFNAAKEGAERSDVNVGKNILIDAFSSFGGFAEFFLTDTGEDLNQLQAKIDSQLAADKAEQNQRAAAIRGRISKLVQEGRVNIVTQFLESLEDDSILNKEQQDSAIAQAKSNQKSAQSSALQAKLNTLALEGSEEQSFRTLDETFQQTAEGSIAFEDQSFIDSENKAQLLREEVTIHAELRENLLSQQEALEQQEVDQWALADLVEEENELVKEKLDVESKLRKAKVDTLAPALKIAALERSFVLDEAKLTEINRQIADAKKAELQDIDKITDLAKERFLIERENLLLTKRATEAQIRSFLKNKNIDVSQLSLEDIFAKFSTDVGREFLRTAENADVLAGLFKKAAETTNKLSSAEDRLAQELDDTLRKPLTDKLAKAQRDLTKQHNTTTRIEGKLNTATGDLADAREALAEELDKAIEDEIFFRNARRKADGENEVQKGDAKDLLQNARDAATNDEAIELAKASVDTAFTLRDQGDISDSQLDRAINSAEVVTQDARAGNVADAQQEVIDAQRRHAQLTQQHKESIQSEAKLQTSVDTLETTIAGLPAQIKAAMAKLESALAANTQSNFASSSGAAGGTNAGSGSSSGSVGSAGSRAGFVGSGTSGGITGSSSRSASSTGTPLPGFGKDLGAAGTSSASSAGESGTISFQKDIGKNTANVLAGDNTRRANLQRAIDSGGISRDAAATFARSIEANLFEASGLSNKADGGLITGPGGPKDDKAGVFALSNNEFVQPADATQKYGKDFMEKLKNLELPASAVRSIGANNLNASGQVSSNSSAAEAIAGIVNGSQGGDLRPVTFNFQGAKLNGKAPDDEIATFRKALSLQALKSGTR